MFRNSVAAMLCVAVCAGVASAKDDSPCKSIADAAAKTDLASLTQSAMAADWNDSANVKYTLHALKSLTMPKRKEGFLDLHPEQAVDTLKKHFPCHADLYQAASSLPNFLDWLATASTQVSSKPNPAATKDLFTRAKTLILKIFEVPSQSGPRKIESGAQRIVEVNDLFAQKINYSGLYLLLNSVPMPTSDEAKKDPSDTYVKRLEDLRSAFATDPDHLAKLVKDQISSPE